MSQYQKPSASVLQNRIWDSSSGRFIDKQLFMQQLVAADYILLGETHDNPAHHQIQNEILQKLIYADVKPAFIMEMLDISDQAAIDEFMQKSTAAGDFDKAVGFSKKGWDWELYRPLVTTAIEEKLLFKGGNLSRSQLTGLVRGQPITDFPELTPMLEQADRLPDQVRNDLREEIIASHCGKLPDSMVPGMMQAQIARDAMLALQTKNAGKPAVLIAGAGHTRLDRAVPYFLSLLDPQSRIISLGMKGVSHDFSPQQKAQWESLYDYAWYTATVEREDPCKKFQIKSTSKTSR